MNTVAYHLEKRLQRSGMSESASSSLYSCDSRASLTNTMAPSAPHPAHLTRSDSQTSTPAQSLADSASTTGSSTFSRLSRGFSDWKVETKLGFKSLSLAAPWVTGTPQYQSKPRQLSRSTPTWGFPDLSNSC